MTQLRRLRTDDDLPKVIAGTNRIFDALLGNDGGRVHLLDDDGILKNTIGGATLGTSEPAFKVRSASGEHVLVQHSAGVITLLEVTDAGVVIYGLTLSGNLLVGGDLTVNGEGNIKGNVTLGDAIGDTVLMTGPVTMNSSLNAKGNVNLGDAEGDTVTITDWVIVVTSNDLLFKDDAGGTVVKIGDQSSTYQLDVAIGDFHVADDAVIGGDLTADSLTIVAGGATITGGFAAGANFLANEARLFAATDLRIGIGSSSKMLVTADGISLVTAGGSFGAGVGVIFIANRTTAPTTNPSGGGILYASAGSLVWRGSAGTVSTIAPA